MNRFPLLFLRRLRPTNRNWSPLGFFLDEGGCVPTITRMRVLVKLTTLLGGKLPTCAQYPEAVDSLLLPSNSGVDLPVYRDLT